jgi:histidine ammonia-lyase
MAGIGERRLTLLLDPDFNRATPFQVPKKGEGLHSGLMIWQVTASALVSELKTLAHPASVDSIPTSLGQEDHVSMSMWAAEKLCQAVERWRTVLAIELLAAWRAMALSGHVPKRGPLAALAKQVQSVHPKRFDDAVLGDAVSAVERFAEEAGARTLREN